MLFRSSEDLIAPAVNVFKKKVNEQTVLVGTVKRALLPNLESAITSNLTSDTRSAGEKPSHLACAKAAKLYPHFPVLLTKIIPATVIPRSTSVSYTHLDVYKRQE